MPIATARTPIYDRWYERAVDILEGRANGMGIPILQTLVRRRHGPAMMYLAARHFDPENFYFDPKRGLALERLVVRREGHSWQLQNLSTSYRNLGDMVRYRYWLLRAERLGDPDVRRERKGFRTRFPYAVMKRYRRYRPWRKALDE